jgi:hypothetical protein
MCSLTLGQREKKDTELGEFGKHSANRTPTGAAICGLMMP